MDINIRNGGEAAMRYFCEYCKTEIRTIYTQTKCPYCGATLEIIPDYETPEQYEKRTGKAYPDDGLVLRPNGFSGKWDVYSFGAMKHYYRECGVPIVIADPPVPPPDDWRPE